MKFAVASDDGATVAAHTGRCGGFVIFESKAAGVTRIEFRANRFTAHAHWASVRGATLTSISRAMPATAT